MIVMIAGNEHFIKVYAKVFTVDDFQIADFSGESQLKIRMDGFCNKNFDFETHK